jgi:hypothetical protein
MNDLPHFAKFARALALGVTAGGVAIAACSGSSASSDTGSATTTTTTTASSGNEAPPPVDTSAADAGSSASAERPADAPVAQGNACTTVGATSRGVASQPGTQSMCECTAGAAGSATWSCSELPVRVMGPLPPPELSA